MTLDAVVGARVQAFREAKRWTQRQLAAEVTKLGAKFHDTTITRIEKGARAVTLDELAALARALDVPPILLTLPLGVEATVELLPGQPVPTWAAVKWWIGEQGYPGDDVRDDPSGILGYFRDYDELLRAARDSYGSGEQDPDGVWGDRLLDLLKNMRRAGVLPPGEQQEGGERGRSDQAD